jgi:hypothetical protein
MPQPGQMPSPEQIAAMQRQLAIDAEKAGMTVPQFIEGLKKKAAENQARMQQQMQQQQQQQGQHPGQQQGQPQPVQQGQPQPIVPGPPNPVALDVAKFLRSQQLKPRTSILNGERKEMFKGKHAVPRRAPPSLHRGELTKLLSQASAPRPRVSRVRKSTPEEPIAPSDHGPGLAREHVQAAAHVDAGAPGHQDRRARGP